MVLKQKKNFLRGWKSASLEAFAATQAMPKKRILRFVLVKNLNTKSLERKRFKEEKINFINFKNFREEVCIKIK